MIRASHASKIYAKPSFDEGSVEYRFQQALAQALARLLQRATDDDLVLGDSGFPMPEEFARRFEDVRDMLVERKLRGKDLAPDEDLVLREINAALQATMVKPAEDLSQVRAALEEAELLLHGSRRSHD